MPPLHTPVSSPPLAAGATADSYGNSLSACVARAGLKITAAMIAVGVAVRLARGAAGVGEQNRREARASAVLVQQPTCAAALMHPQAADDQTTALFNDGNLSLTFFAPDGERRAGLRGRHGSARMGARPCLRLAPPHVLLLRLRRRRQLLLRGFPQRRESRSQ